MTAREKFLLALFGWTLGGALTLIGVFVYLDEMASLDTRFSGLQKEAVQLQRVLMTHQSADLDDPGFAVEERFFPSGRLPDPTSLARTIKPVLDRYGIGVVEFQVLTASSLEFSLRYTFVTPLVPFFRAFADLRSTDSHLVVRKFVASVKEHGVYSVVWEVGYAALP